VGLLPTQGAGFVTLDSDCNGIFKIDENALDQKFALIQEKDGARKIQILDLSKLTLS
jgi:hypothetical protein